MYFYSNQLSQNCYIPHNPIYLQSQDSLINTTTTTATTTATNTMHSPTNTTHTTHNTSATMLPLSSSYPAISNPMNYPIYSEHEYYLTHTSMNDLPLAPSVPSMLPVNYSVDKMSYY
ncbi:hypothetical protein G6F56_010989 [Rhizopus delemar]|nr:hypothetical protein G6F56_010989 [Rhizopus delemar]